MPKEKKSKLRQPADKEQEYLDGWKRERAAFENFRKEQEKRLDEFRKYATSDVLSSLLDIMDNFYLATKHAPVEIGKHKWFEGMGHIEKQFEKILSRWGVKEIETEGVFDPMLHEVIEEISSDEQTGNIVEVVQKGYRMGDTILRPTKVRVVK